jgi:hypothetical protein
LFAVLQLVFALTLLVAFQVDWARAKCPQRTRLSTTIGRIQVGRYVFIKSEGLKGLPVDFGFTSLK